MKGLEDYGTVVHGMDRKADTENRRRMEPDQRTVRARQCMWLKFCVNLMCLEQYECNAMKYSDIIFIVNIYYSYFTKSYLLSYKLKISKKCKIRIFKRFIIYLGRTNQTFLKEKNIIHFTDLY